MAISPEPKRPNRTAWWAEWVCPGGPGEGSDYAIGHDRWIEMDPVTKELWYVDRAPGSFMDTPRSERVIALLRKKSVLLIQRDGPNQEFRGWHSAWEIEDLEVRGSDARGSFWFKCRLKQPRLA
jgi:hypothetical protein